MRRSPPHPGGRGQSASAHRRGSRERLPRRRRDGAGGLRQVDPARRVGGAPRTVRSAGCRWTASTTTPRRCSPCWLRPTGGSRRSTPTWSPTWAASVCRCWVAPRRAWPPRSGPAPSPFVLMLDDLHELRSPDCHDALGVVIAGIPAGSQLVAASRSEQPHLPRLRASGDAFELGAGDLALDAAGARADLLAGPRRPHARGGRRGDRAHRRLAGRPLPRRADRQGQPRRGADDHRRRPLRRRLPVPRVLGAAARGTPAVPAAHGGARPALRPHCATRCSGEPDAQAQLRELEASNLFLVPLDRRREWYRYHALFREFLLGELRRVEPDLIDEAAPAGRGLVRGERIAGPGPRAPAEHRPSGTGASQLVTRSWCCRPTAPARSSTVQRWLVGARRRRSRRRTRRWPCSPAGSPR